MNAGNASSYAILNFSDLLKRLDGDLVFLEELLGMFRTEFPVQMQRLNAGIAAEDFTAAERAAHTLKGMLANLSMPVATSTASKIEMAARAHSLGETIEAVLPLPAQVQEALQAVETQRVSAQ